MNIVEMYEKCKEIYKQTAWWENGEYQYVGLRFEDKERQVGEIIEDVSRDNEDREDEREFPEYGTDEYFEMPELDGVSAWDMSVEATYTYSDWDAEKDDCRSVFTTKHCYIIAGNKATYGPDDNEVVIQDAVVIAQVF